MDTVCEDLSAKSSRNSMLDILFGNLELWRKPAYNEKVVTWFVHANDPFL